MSFRDKLAGIFGIEYEYEDEPEEITPAIPEPEEKPIKRPSVTFNTIPRATEEIKQAYRIFEPTSYDDCQHMADELKKGNYIIIKYSSTTTDLARRIFYFMEGCIYALNGSKEKVSNEVFLYTPRGTEVKRQLSGSSTLKTPWR